MAKRIKLDIGQPQIVGVSLIDVDIAQATLDEERENEAEFQYDADIESLELLDSGLAVFACVFALRKTYPGVESDITRFKAKYYCGLRDIENLHKAEETAKAVAATTVWSSFTSLCALATQQMGASFPILPPIPEGIEIKRSEKVSIP